MDELGKFESSLVNAIGYYLERCGQILERVSKEPSSKELLSVKLAPDAFDTGFHLAVAIQFAARALCEPNGRTVPEITEPYSLETLHSLYHDVTDAVANAEIGPRSRVKHVAGNAELEQSAADYLTHFAFPNMLFHLSQAYAGLRSAGLGIGKADFDGLHRY